MGNDDPGALDRRTRSPASPPPASGASTYGPHSRGDYYRHWAVELWYHDRRGTRYVGVPAQTGRAPNTPGLEDYGVAGPQPWASGESTERAFESTTTSGR